VREPEGIATPPPGKSSERPWSKHREPDIRNVEAEGSSPFTSTKGPGQRAKVGLPEGHEALLSATWFVVELEDGSTAHSAKIQVTSRPTGDSRISVGVGGASGRRVSLRVFIYRLWFPRRRTVAHRTTTNHEATAGVLRALLSANVGG